MERPHILSPRREFRFDAAESAGKVCAGECKELHTEQFARRSFDLGMRLGIAAAAAEW